MHAAGDDAEGVRLRGLIVVLWRAGSASARRSRSRRATSTPAEARSWSDTAKAASAARSAWTAGPGINSRPGSRCAPRCRSARCSAFSVVQPAAGPGRPPASAPSFTRQLPAPASGGASRPSAASRARGGDVARRVPLLVIQRQLGHADLAITSVYLREIDNTEIVHTVHERPAPMVPAPKSAVDIARRHRPECCPSLRPESRRSSRSDVGAVGHHRVPREVAARRHRGSHSFVAIAVARFETAPLEAAASVRTTSGAFGRSALPQGVTGRVSLRSAPHELVGDDRMGVEMRPM